jgi:hypothetical protein
MIFLFLQLLFDIRITPNLVSICFGRRTGKYLMTTKLKTAFSPKWPLYTVSSEPI